MPIPVDHTSRAPVMDTLPVIKLTHWYGTPARDAVYSYARLAIGSGALHLAVTVFDREPPPTQRFAALLQLPGGTLRLTFGPGHAEAQRMAPDGTATALPLPAGGCIAGAGEDEQGWYWQVRTALPQGWLSAHGLQLPEAGSLFRGAFILQDGNEEAFGSAFAAPDAADPRPESCMGDFAAIRC